MHLLADPETWVAIAFVILMGLFDANHGTIQVGGRSITTFGKQAYRPVSYTHLDVYKRQLLDSARRVSTSLSSCMRRIKG